MLDNTGIILSGVGGNYEVLLDSGLQVRCKARGVFRLQHLTPLIGDRVRVSAQQYIEEISPRRNSLVRPAAANIDQLLVVIAVHHPQPHFLMLDRFLVEAERRQIEVGIVLSKMDLWSLADQQSIEMAIKGYEAAGYPIYRVSTREEGETPWPVENLRTSLQNKITVLAGPSGVGKSSLINLLVGARQETGELSEKIARGKNTTRAAKLLPVQGGGLIADTPGFSSLQLWELNKEDLAQYYPEFTPFLGQCRFPDCRHDKEPDCAIKQAVQSGEVAPFRYENYLKLYQELQQ